MIQNEINCCLISIYPIPNGLAATNRILAYGKGLVNNGCYLDILLPNPSDRLVDERELLDYGNHEGINYIYTTGRYKNSFKIARAFSILTGFRSIYGYINTFKEIIKRHKLKKYDALIISNDDLRFLFVYSVLCKALKVKSIFIFDEYPKPIRHKLKEKIPIWKKYLYRIILKRIDAYVSISRELKIYYNSICKKPTLILPIIINTSRFNHIQPTLQKTNKRKYLCYMGNMEITKDNVDNIIKSFGKISKQYSEIDLHLYGQPKEKTFKFLKKIVELQNIKDRVFFMGKVSSNLVPNILINAEILVSSQPKTLRASGGFPTKLGEYLATGVPTLLTNVGENSKYAKDNEHLFFAPPNDSKLYAEKISYILENYEEAKTVAENGKILVEKNYSHIIMGLKLKKFIKQIQS
jgi:glycosyltransferase involved in cell wall biosynthesis